MSSVEKRKRPKSTPNGGVDVPWIMAWTAIGSDGVEVKPLVGVKTGEGVITKKVGELVRVTVAVAGGTVDVAEAWGARPEAVGVTTGAGAVGA